MGIDSYGNWDGICACKKIQNDGIKCKLGATHNNLLSLSKTIIGGHTTKDGIYLSGVYVANDKINI